MRIAAGVLLIIAGILNAFGGMTYGAVGGSSAMVEQAAKEGKAMDGSALTDEQKAALANAAAVTSNVKAGTGIFGIFLFAMLGLQIAGAVTLFMSKAAKFVMVVAILGIVAELAGPFYFGPPINVGFGIANIIGIVGSVLALLGAKGYANKTA